MEIVLIVIKLEDGSTADLEWTTLGVVTLRRSRAYFTHGRQYVLLGTSDATHSELCTIRFTMIYFTETRHGAVTIVLPDYKTLLHFRSQIGSSLLE